ncbi:hypothetical protein LCGC14_2155240 [marine sediment metagenome]|uniref:Uncharacterized protein n=1 Tax=marine sediment metagenome TaxID=412755 RepID=A0A0F9GQN2_9ZZZZ
MIYKLHSQEWENIKWIVNAISKTLSASILVVSVLIMTATLIAILSVAGTTILNIKYPNEDKSGATHEQTTTRLPAF